MAAGLARCASPDHAVDHNRESLDGAWIRKATSMEPERNMEDGKYTWKALANDLDSETEGENFSSRSSEFSESELKSQTHLQRARCRSEKNRRDKLNLYINDLHEILMGGSAKKIDKLSILKMTVNYLKLHGDFTVSVGGDGKSVKSFFLPSDVLSRLMVETLNAFIMVIDDQGKVLYVADAIKSVLGCEVPDVRGKHCSSFVHEADLPKVMDIIDRGSLSADQFEARQRAVSLELARGDEGCGDVELEFRMRVVGKMDDADARSESYGRVSCFGRWYPLQLSPDTEITCTSSRRLVLLVARTSPSPLDVRHVSAGDEDTSVVFTSKHGMDGKFLFADTKWPRITGYLPYELVGKSIYSFVHADDTAELIKAHKTFLGNAKEEGVVLCFRFRSKGEDWLLLNAKIFAALNQTTRKSEFLTIRFSLANDEEMEQFKSVKLTVRSSCNMDDRLVECSLQSTVLQKDHTKCSLPSDVSPLNSAFRLGRSYSEQMLPSSIAFKLEDQLPSTDVVCSVRHAAGDVSLPACTPTCTRLASPSESALPTAARVEIQDEEDDIQQSTILDAQEHLHRQLVEKHESMEAAFARQKQQLDKIAALMTEYCGRMQDAAFLEHFKQQRKMLDYFTCSLKKQQRQQKHLRKLLKVKVSELAIRKRAVKLRYLANRQQRILAEMKDAKMKHARETDVSEKKPMFASEVAHGEKLHAAASALHSKSIPPAERSTFSRLPAGDNQVSGNSVPWKPVVSAASLALADREASASKDLASVSTLRTDAERQMTAWCLRSTTQPLTYSALLASPLSTPLAALDRIGDKSLQSQLELLQRQQEVPQRAFPYGHPTQQDDFGKFLSSIHPEPSSGQSQFSAGVSSTDKNNAGIDLLYQRLLSQVRRNQVPAFELERPIDQNCPLNNGGMTHVDSISKQILIQLQGLQQQILSQLEPIQQLGGQSDTGVALLNVLPILQLLQNLQKTIIEQQAQNLVSSLPVHFAQTPPACRTPLHPSPSPSCYPMAMVYPSRSVLSTSSIMHPAPQRQMQYRGGPGRSDVYDDSPCMMMFPTGVQQRAFSSQPRHVGPSQQVLPRPHSSSCVDSMASSASSSFVDLKSLYSVASFSAVTHPALPSSSAVSQSAQQPVWSFFSPPCDYPSVSLGTGGAAVRYASDAMRPLCSNLDCFPNIPSPELNLLMYGGVDDRAPQSGDGGSGDSELSKGNEDDKNAAVCVKTLPDDDLSDLQRLLENQEYMFQLQESQRLQIRSQQQQQLQLVRLQRDDRCLAVRNTSHPHSNQDESCLLRQQELPSTSDRASSFEQPASIPLSGAIMSHAFSPVVLSENVDQSGAEGFQDDQESRHSDVALCLSGSMLTSPESDSALITALREQSDMFWS